jgi:hypothetical protein
VAAVVRATAVRQHRLEPGQGSIRPGRDHGDRHGTGVEAAEERGYEIETRRVEQEHLRPLRPGLAQSGRDGPCPPIQFAVGQADFSRLAVHEEGEGDAVPVPGGPHPKKIDQGRNRVSGKRARVSFIKGFI